MNRNLSNSIASQTKTNYFHHMKNLLLLISILTASVGFSQTCVVDKCTGSPATATAINTATGLPFDATYTITWASTLPGFSPTTGNEISWATVGNTVGSYTVSYTVSDGINCDTTYECTINVIQGVQPSSPDVTVCVNPGSVASLPVASPTGGVFTDSGGNVITQVTTAMIGQTLNYTVSASGCSGATTFTVIGQQPPIGTLIIN